jgi:phage baseplate assembly protein W
VGGKMNEWLKNMMGKLKDLWSKWKPIQKVIIIGIVLVVIVVIIASARLSSAPTTVRLFNAPVTDQAALTNILNFKNGESILDPRFGMSELYQLIYAPFDKFSSGKIIAAIRTIINTYEPRIQILDIPATYSEEKQEYYITINYLIPELGQTASFNYNIVK